MLGTNMWNNAMWDWKNWELRVSRITSIRIFLTRSLFFRCGWTRRGCSPPAPTRTPWCSSRCTIRRCFLLQALVKWGKGDFFGKKFLILSIAMYFSYFRILRAYLERHFWFSWIIPTLLRNSIFCTQMSIPINTFSVFCVESGSWPTSKKIRCFVLGVYKKVVDTPVGPPCTHF